EGVSNPTSGRVTSIAIDPTDGNTVYIGSANGGVWRTRDSGQTWTPIFDNAQSLAIGSLAFSPSNHTTLFVGTGEANGSGESYAGVGVYRIDNASTTADLVGPINPIRNYIAGDGVTAVSNPIFRGRSISKVLVHPTNPNIVFVATVSGAMGMGGEAA